MAILPRKQLASMPAPTQVQRSYLGGVIAGAGGGNFVSNGTNTTSTSGEVVNEITALNLTALWRGVNVLGSDIMKPPLEVFQHQSNGKGKQPDYKHDVFKLLNYPNNYQTGRKLRYATAVHLVLYQQSFQEIIRDEDTGKPLYLHLLDPRLIEPIRENGEILYKFRTGVSPYSGNKRLRAENILHFTGFSLDGISGLSGVKMCNESLGLGMAVQEWASTFFANNAQPAGIVECPPGWDEIARTNFRDEWQSQYGGLRNGNKVAILEEGAKFVATTFNPEQLQLLGVRAFTVQEVCRILGLPGSKLGDMSHEASRSLSEANRDYIDSSLSTYLCLIEDEINFKLFTEEERGTYYVKHDISSLTRPDALTQAQINEIEMRNGVRTWNEWRASIGLNPFAEDGRVIPLNMEKVADPEVVAEVEDKAPEVTDVGKPLEPAPDVVTAARSLARDAIGKIVRREAKNLKRHCGAGIDRAWVAGYYGKELPVWTEALAPSLALLGAATGSTVEADQVVDYVAQRSREAVEATGDLEALIQKWGDTKADEILSIMEGTTDGGS